MSEEATILSISDMQKLVDEVEATQDLMLVAIKDWEAAKAKAVSAGMEWHYADHNTQKAWVFPVERVTYTPAIEFTFNNR